MGGGWSYEISTPDMSYEIWLKDFKLFAMRIEEFKVILI
jgi:hypothetical protein